MNKKVVVGIVGLSMRKQHLAAAVQYGAEIAAICDINEKTLASVGTEYGIPIQKQFTDYHVLVQNPHINLIIIAAPDQLHRQMCEDFLAAGKHVMCEKPLALTRRDMQTIIHAAQKQDTKFMVGQICRFTPAFVKAKELIDAGTIGELYYTESEYAHDYAKILHGWREDSARHGVIGGGCHAVDLLRWYAGDPLEVFAYGTHKMLPQVPYDDATIAVLKFPNRIIGKVFVSTGCKRPYTMRTLLYGTKGTIICDNTSDHMILYTLGEDGISIKAQPEIIPLEIKNHNTTKEFEVFAKAIENNLPITMDAIQGAKTIAVCLAIVESSSCGRPIAPDYHF